MKTDHMIKITKFRPSHYGITLVWEVEIVCSYICGSARIGTFYSEVDAVMFAKEKARKEGLPLQKKIEEPKEKDC